MKGKLLSCDFNKTKKIWVCKIGSKAEGWKTFETKHIGAEPKFSYRVGVREDGLFEAYSYPEGIIDCDVSKIETRCVLTHEGQRVSI